MVMNTDEEIKKEGFTFVSHSGSLYVRNKEMTDTPFKKIDKSTMKFDSVAPPITFKNEDTKKRWTYTDAELNAPLREEIGKRWQHVCPMASDDKHIYTLVEYYEDEIDKAKRTGTYCEKYLLEDGKLEFV